MPATKKKTSSSRSAKAVKASAPSKSKGKTKATGKGKSTRKATTRSSAAASKSKSKANPKSITKSKAQPKPKSKPKATKRVAQKSAPKTKSKAKTTASKSATKKSVASAASKALKTKTTDKKNLKTKKAAIAPSTKKGAVKKAGAKAKEKAEKEVVAKKVPAKKFKKMEINRLLISQPVPETGNSPYYELGRRLKIEVEFFPFIEVEAIPSRQFRRARINPYEYSAVIFTSRQAIDHFFRVCEEMRIKMSMETKYFCTSEAVALYLQKYIQYRKRKVNFGTGRMSGLKEILTKHKAKEKFLLPCAELHKADLPNFLEQNGYNFDKAVIYKTVYTNLKKVKPKGFDIIALFSPSGVLSLKHNFPKFRQGKTVLAALGAATQKEVLNQGLRVDISAPTADCPSMPMAITKFVKQHS